MGTSCFSSSSEQKPLTYKVVPVTSNVDMYAKTVGMDDANKRILMIFKTQGEAAGFKALMTREDGTEMSYAESRARYG